MRTTVRWSRSGRETVEAVEGKGKGKKEWGGEGGREEGGGRRGRERRRTEGGGGDDTR